MLSDEEKDNLPKHVKPKLKALDSLSLDELRAYIEDLRGEISRVEDEIKRKTAHAAAAAAIFGKKE